jgi:hypothetical protein
MLLSPTVDAVCGRDGDFSSTLSTFAGSTVDSWFMPGSCRLGPKSAWLSDRSSDLRYAGDPSPRSAVCRNHDGSFDERDKAIEARDIRFSSDAMDAFLRWLDRVGDVEPGDRFAKSREEGRCCHDSVPARLRDRAGTVRGDSGSVSCTDPRRECVV